MVGRGGGGGTMAWGYAIICCPIFSSVGWLISLILRFGIGC